MRGSPSPWTVTLPATASPAVFPVTETDDCAPCSTSEMAVIPVPVSVRVQVDLDPGSRPARQRGDRPAHRSPEPGHVTVPAQGVAGPGQAVGGPQPIAGCIVHAREGPHAARVRDDLTGPQVGDHQEAGAGHGPVDQRGRDGDLLGRRNEVDPRLLADPALRPSPIGSEPPSRKSADSPASPVVATIALVAAEQGNALGGHRARRNRRRGARLAGFFRLRVVAMYLTLRAAPRPVQRTGGLARGLTTTPPGTARTLGRVGGCSPYSTHPA